jgi:hypothetical protein
MVAFRLREHIGVRFNRVSQVFYGSMGLMYEGNAHMPDFVALHALAIFASNGPCAVGVVGLFGTSYIVSF